MGLLNVIVGFIFCVLAPTVLQTVGFWTDQWTKSSAHVKCTHDVHTYYPTCRYERADLVGAEEWMYFLPILSFLSSFLPLAIAAYSYRSKPYDIFTFRCISMICVGSLGGFLVFPSAGVFILLGSIMFSMRYPTLDLGLSFILCLLAGCIHIVSMLSLVVIQCRHCLKKDQTSSDPTYLTAIPSVSGAVPYSKEPHTVRVTEDEVTIQTESGIILAIKYKVGRVRNV